MILLHDNRVLSPHKIISCLVHRFSRMLWGECAMVHQTARTPTTDSLFVEKQDCIFRLYGSYSIQGHSIFFLAGPFQISAFVDRILEPSLMIDIEDSKTLSVIGDMLA